MSLSLCEGLLSTSLLAQWIEQNSQTTVGLAAVDFAGARIGYVVGGYGTILKTTDAGMDWFLLSIDTSWSNAFVGVDYLNPDTGTVVGQNIVLRTTDGGQNWVQQSPPWGGYGVSFVNSARGLIAAVGGILRTTNGGNDWAYVSVASTMLNAVQLVDSNIAFAVGDNLNFNYNIYKSANSGLTWEEVGSGNGEDLHGVSFANAMTGLVVGHSGSIYLTTNGGNSWMRKGWELPGGNFRSVSMSGVNNATAVGEGGVIVRTTDGGFTWSLQQNPTTSHLYGVVMVDSLNVWAVGAHGTILHTTNGGITAALPEENTIPRSFRLEQNYPNPFNPSSTIRYVLPHSSLVTLTVYSTVGHQVAQLVNERQQAGYHEAVFRGDGLASGVYFYRLEAGGFVSVKRLLLLK